jgi:hypothetical protein
MMKEWQWLAAAVMAFSLSCGEDGDPSGTEGVADGLGGDAPTESSGSEAGDDCAAGMEACPRESVEVPPDALAHTPGGLLLGLPFAFERPDAGEPVSPAELASFTKELAGFWDQIDFFTWVYETSHGVDASTGFPDYLIWWHDVEAVKEGDQVTFRNNPAYGGSHNNAEPTNLVLAPALCGYLLTGDEAMRMVAEQFTKSNSACMEGFVYDADDPLHHLLARNIVTFDHEFLLPSGKKKGVKYSDWYFSYEGWNANRYEYQDNPTWGDVWVTTMRSKDDVPYIYQSAAWLPYVIELSAEPALKEAAEKMLALVEASARDIVESGWIIRTKDAQGKAYSPKEDLASLNAYVGLFPDAECDARLATALMGYGEPHGIECGEGQGSLYDEMAGRINYFNYQIVDHFHVAALQLALVRGESAVAEALALGLARRLEGYLDPAREIAGQEDESWGRDLSVLLVKAAAFGVPLTSAEVRLVHQYHQAAVDRYSTFPNWDLWDPAVPDGVYDFREGFQPKRGPDAVRIEEVVLLLEYCWSPFRNPAGRPLLDCALVADRPSWGR